MNKMNWMEIQIQYEKDHYKKYDVLEKEWMEIQIQYEKEHPYEEDETNGIDEYTGGKSLEDIINKNINIRLAQEKKYIIDNRKIRVWIRKKSYKRDYFRVLPCNLYQALYKTDLTKNELKILLYLIDITVGFHRHTTDNGDEWNYGISLYKISKETGIQVKNVKQSMISLERKNIIWRWEVTRAENSARIYTYYFNDHFEFWNIHNTTFQSFIKKEIELQPDRLKKRQNEIAIENKRKRKK